MLIYVQSFLGVVLDVLSCKIFFETFGAKKKEKNTLRNIGTTFVVAILGFLVAMLLDHFFLIKQAVTILMITVWMTVHLKMTVWKNLILATLFQELLIVTDIFALLVTRNIEWLQKNTIVYVSLTIALGKAILFCGVLVVRKVICKNKLIVVDSEWLRFIFFPIFTICVIAAMIQKSGSIDNLVQENLYFVITCGLTGMNVFALYLINDIIKRETKAREEQIYKLKVKNQVEMYRSISENFDKQRKRAHEYNNRITCIASLIKRKQYDALEDFISNISGKFSTDMDFICTNHVIVDAILNTKYQELKEKGIVFVFKLDDLSALKISNEDIVVILSNLLNNAVEACEECKGSRVIKLKFVMEDDAVIISVKNTYENMILYKNGEIQTTKIQASEEHGIGIKNVIEIIAKYGGSYVINNDEREFSFSTIIPMYEK